jgi:hypothetical protein
MHLHLVIACCIVEVTQTEVTKLTEVFKLCHLNLLLLIEIYNIDIQDA